MGVWSVCAHKPKSKSLLQTGDNLSIRTVQESMLKKKSSRTVGLDYEDLDGATLSQDPASAACTSPRCMILQVEKTQPPIRTSQRQNGPISFRNSAGLPFLFHAENSFFKRVWRRVGHLGDFKHSHSYFLKSSKRQQNGRTFDPVKSMFHIL